LRSVQFKKAGAAGTGFFKEDVEWRRLLAADCQGTNRPAHHPANALAIAEQVLNGDPYNSAAHRLIVQAAETLELPQTGILSLETLVKNSPKDKGLAIEFPARWRKKGGDATLGERVLRELMRVAPNDPRPEPGVEEFVPRAKRWTKAVTARLKAAKLLTAIF